MHARTVNGRIFRVRQAASNGDARRDRFVRRIAALPDAPARWAILFQLLERQLDVDRDALDRVVGAVIDLSPEQVGLFAKIRGQVGEP
jgi:hypothetical protein